MIANLFPAASFAISFLLLFGSAEWLYHHLKVKAELSRKYVHFTTGLISLLFPCFLSSHWMVLLLCGSFFFLLLASLKWNLLPSINGVDRVTRGSLLYPLVVYACFLLYQQYDLFLFFYIPILILAISDPIAALVGKKWPKFPYSTFGHTKTASGSFGFFSSAFIICMLGLLFSGQTEIATIILIATTVAFASTLAEALSHKGYDNLTIPCCVSGLLIFFKAINFIS